MKIPRTLASAAVLAALVAAPLQADVDPALSGPANQRGFAPDQAFAVGDIDHINNFNGNLILTIPIGPAYPVSSALSYQLVLSYNARLWDFDYSCGAGDPGGPLRVLLEAASGLQRRGGVAAVAGEAAAAWDRSQRHVDLAVRLARRGEPLVCGNAPLGRLERRGHLLYPRRELPADDAAQRWGAEGRVPGRRAA